MGTHITIAEFILISLISIVGYAFVTAFYQTYIKRK